MKALKRADLGYSRRKNITENQPHFALSIIDKKPITLHQYEQGFHLVQHELQKVIPIYSISLILPKSN